MDFIDPLTPTAISDATGGAFRGKVQAQAEASVATNIVFDWLTGINKELFNIIVTEAGLTPDVGNNTQLFEALSTIFATSFNKQIFTTSGIYTKPNFLKAAWVEVQAGGGGGGGCLLPGANSGACGGGGGGGEYQAGLIVPALIGATETVTIGAAGGGGVGSGISGASGGNSSFGGLIIANGATGGTGSSTAIVQNGRGEAGGGGGSAGSGGDLSIVGQEGSIGSVFSDDAISGTGGDSGLGIGGGVRPENSSISSKNATGFGGGGGGACQFGAGAAGTGGTGRDGIIIVTEFF